MQEENWKDQGNSIYFLTDPLGFSGEIHLQRQTFQKPFPINPNCLRTKKEVDSLESSSFGCSYYRTLLKSTSPFCIDWIQENYGRRATSSGRCPLFYIRMPFCPKTVRSFQTAPVREFLWLCGYSRYSSPAACRWEYGGQG